MTGVVTKEKEASGYKYEITYIDPADLEGMRSKTSRLSGESRRGKSRRKSRFDA